MAMFRLGALRGRVFLSLTMGAGMLGACGPKKGVDPVNIVNRTTGPMTIAVAPALNLSGASDFDPDRFADLMASELGFADGIAVIPVSRVLAVLRVQGRVGIESPTHALELVELLGADAILVFAVTEYDPYDPPSIGIAAQLFGNRPGTRHSMVDPVALSDQDAVGGIPRPDRRRQALGQVQRVFDASHGSLVEEIRAFAGYRQGDEGPYGWRKYVVSQQHFIRFCCHATIRALLEGVRKSEFAVASRDW